MDMSVFIFRFSAFPLLLLYWAFALKGKIHLILGWAYFYGLSSSMDLALQFFYLGSYLMSSNIVFIFCLPFKILLESTMRLGFRNFGEGLNSFIQLVFIEWQIYTRYWR